LRSNVADTEFLHIKQLPLRRYAYLEDRQGTVVPGTEPKGRDEAALALEEALRATVRKDRALYELGMRAFVSWVRAYTKHEVSYIFRLADLPLDALACEFALLNFPRMPEVTAWRNEHPEGSMLFHEDMPDVRFRSQLTSAS